MEAQSLNLLKHNGIIEIQRILHEITEEPGPCFSFYSVLENCTRHCIDCEIHYEGKTKNPIHITMEQLKNCVQSEQGRLWLKEQLRKEILNLISEEDWYNNA